MKRQPIFRFALALILSLGSQVSLAQGEIYVTNWNSNSVTVYARTGSGNLAPVRTLVGAATGLAQPSGLAVDEVNNELFVVNHLPPESVTVYPRTANGNVAPLRTITGALTLLADSRGISLDIVNNELAVVNRIGAFVRVFARTATGNVAPLRSIIGQATVLSNPTDLAFDVVHNELIVANNGGSLGTHARTASGNTPPLRTISGLATGFNNGPIGVALDIVNDEVVVTNPSFGPSFLPSLLVFARSASGNVAPLRAIVGAATGLTFNPSGVAVDAVNNELVMVNGGNNSIRFYARTADGNVAPLRTIAGAATQLNNPQFLVVTTSTSPPALASAASRKVHGGAGTFALPLSLASNSPTTEPRQGTAHTIVFTFDKPIASATAAITQGTATAAVPTFSGNDVVVGLSGVTDQQYVTIGLSNITSVDGGTGGSGLVRVGFLVGDVNQNRVVTVADLGLVNAQLSQLVTAANYLKDVNANGTLTLADKGITNANLTKSLPVP
jgi:hypothetical protein